MILINLTGDYKVDTPSGNTASELVHLDALLAALRGNASKTADPLYDLISGAVAKIKRPRLTGLALQITSSLDGNKLTHDFRIVEI